MDGGRKMQAIGTCDEYGDVIPNGVARVRVEYKSWTALHVIALDYDEARMLMLELQEYVTGIEATRAALQSKST